eukprot:CAMPEP_0171330640 /NCGR_PEP_ID=MMETSP0878-20121228/2151_1 /TAXON_ID=67004 /ORGANISM="Thalassiosira weissflogii, Strain CCMP1336" /LENGTH=309 /DNA_ID=CAMNT_0011830997 /DNA_START=56 /DNA_END=985 /DNA_ORIENTATION=-
MYHDRQTQPPDTTLSTNPSTPTALALRSLRSFTTRHKLLTTTYLYGLTALFLLLLLGTGTKLTAEQHRRYSQIMNSIDLEAEFSAASEYHAAHSRYYHSKGWFTCDQRCRHFKSIMEQKYDLWQEVQREGRARMSDAKKVAGLTSEIGVGEVMDSFWDYFDGGKKFAKRQSYWDAFFVGMRSMGRDESFVEYALKMLMQVLVNFSLGLIMALIFFVFGLWNIIKTYQPNPLAGLLFFLTAASAAFAFVSTYLLAMYGAAAGGLYGVVKLAESNRRIEAARNNGYGNGDPYRRNIGGNGAGGAWNRPHYS